mgnify:CR=1 FL=1
MILEALLMALRVEHEECSEFGGFIDGALCRARRVLQIQWLLLMLLCAEHEERSEFEDFGGL